MAYLRQALCIRSRQVLDISNCKMHPPLMPATRCAISLIKRWSPNGVCEIGAGDGFWLTALRHADVKSVGYDIFPRSAHVMLGDHGVASEHKEMSLLIIWPPDGSLVRNWIKSWRGDTIILGMKTLRVSLGDCLDNFSVKDSITICGGRKGPTTLSVWDRST